MNNTNRESYSKTANNGTAFQKNQPGAYQKQKFVEIVTARQLIKPEKLSYFGGVKHDVSKPKDIKNMNNFRTNSLKEVISKRRSNTSQGVKNSISKDMLNVQVNNKREDFRNTKIPLGINLSKKFAGAEFLGRSTIEDNFSKKELNMEDINIDNILDDMNKEIFEI